MNRNVLKVSKIIEELTTFFLKKGYNNFDISVGREKKECSIEFILPTCKDCDIDYICEQINLEQLDCIEEYGWQLIGESECSNELELIGMLVDKVCVEKTDDKVIFKLIKKN